MAIIEVPSTIVGNMEFSTIGSEDTLEEAEIRLESVNALIVLGSENILGVLTIAHLSRSGNCGAACELDILVDPTPEQCSKWSPRFIIITDNGEPSMLSRGP